MKTTTALAAPPAIPYATAAARNGAEHGVASAVTRTPLRNASAAGGVRPAATESVPPTGVELEDAGHVERGGEHDQRERAHHGGALELVAPPDLGAGRAQGEQHPDQRPHRHEHARAEEQRVAPRGPSRRAPPPRRRRAP